MKIISIDAQIKAARTYLKTSDLPSIYFTSHFDFDHYGNKYELLKGLKENIRNFESTNSSTETCMTHRGLERSEPRLAMKLTQRLVGL